MTRHIEALTCAVFILLLILSVGTFGRMITYVIGG